jgi:hypothetical protein
VYLYDVRRRHGITSECDRAQTRLAYSSSYTILGFLPRAVSPDRGMGSSQLNFDHEDVCMGGEAICIYTCIHATSTHRDDPGANSGH